MPTRLKGPLRGTYDNKEKLTAEEREALGIK